MTNQTFEQLFPLLGNIFYLKPLHINACLSSHFLAGFFVFNQIADLLRQFFYIPVFHQQPVLSVVDDVARTARTGERYRRHTTGHCFNNHHSEPLKAGGKHENRTFAIFFNNVRHGTFENTTGSDSQRINQLLKFRPHTIPVNTQHPVRMLPGNKLPGRD